MTYAVCSTRSSRIGLDLVQPPAFLSGLLFLQLLFATLKILVGQLPWLPCVAAALCFLWVLLFQSLGTLAAVPLKSGVFFHFFFYSQKKVLTSHFLLGVFLLTFGVFFFIYLGWPRRKREIFLPLSNLPFTWPKNKNASNSLVMNASKWSVGGIHGMNGFLRTWGWSCWKVEFMQMRLDSQMLECWWWNTQISDTYSLGNDIC